MRTLIWRTRALSLDFFDLHRKELTQATWADPDIAFEFVAAGASDPRLEKAVALMQRFWSTIDRRPPLKAWRDCVMIARDPKSYLVRAGSWTG
ncbi:MAG: hypothetical protein K2P58_13475 [Hyphomonadaceae bacterium]|nr:hypothetical protein [Hyphomonadaceae bacterium]